MTVCKNCGERIIKVNYALGPEWTHQLLGCSGHDGIHKYCYITEAEPEDEMGDIAARGQDILAGLPRSYDPDGTRFDEEKTNTKSNLDPFKRQLENVGYHVLTDEDLKRYCDQARAYGWEAGRIYGELRGSEIIPALQPVYTSHHANPFVNPEWDADLNLPQGFLLSCKDGPL